MNNQRSGGLMENEAAVRTHYEGFDKEIRGLINQETSLVSTKLHWFILVQGLLLTAFSQFSDKGVFYSVILSSLGLSVSLAMKYSFWGSEKAIAKILKSWDDYRDRYHLSHEDFPPVFAGIGWEYSKREKLIKKIFNRPYIFLSYVFIITWLLTYLLLL